MRLLLALLCVLGLIRNAEGFAKPAGLLEIVRTDKAAWCRLQLPSKLKDENVLHSGGDGSVITRGDACNATPAPYSCTCWKVAEAFCEQLSEPTPTCEAVYIDELEKAMGGEVAGADPLEFLIHEGGWLKMKKTYQSQDLSVAFQIKIHIAGGYRARTVDFLLNKIKAGWEPAGGSAAAVPAAAASERGVEWTKYFHQVEWQMAGSVNLFSDYDVNLVGKDAVQTAALFPLLWLEEFGDPSKPWTWTSSELFDTNCYTPHLLPPEATRDGKREQFNADRKRMDPALRAGMQANAWTMSLTKMLLDAKLHVAARYTAEDPDFVEKVRTEFNRYVPTIADLERAAAATGTTDALPIAKELMTRMRVTAEKCVEQQEKTDALRFAENEALKPAEDEALKLMQRAMSSAAYGAAAEKITGTGVPALLKRQELELLEARDAAEAYASHGTVYSIVGITQMNLVGFVPEPGREADSDDACLYVDRDDRGRIVDGFELDHVHTGVRPKKVVAREPIAILGEELLAALWENAAFFADHAGHAKAPGEAGSDLVEQAKLLKESGKYLGRIGLVFAMLQKMDPSINCLGCVLDRAPTAREHQYQCDAKMGYDWMVELAKPEWRDGQGMGHAAFPSWVTGEVLDFGRTVAANSALIIAASKDEQYFLNLLLTPPDDDEGDLSVGAEVDSDRDEDTGRETAVPGMSDRRNKYGLIPIFAGDGSAAGKRGPDDGRQEIFRTVFGARSSLERSVEKLVKELSARLLLHFVAASMSTLSPSPSSPFMPTIPLNCDLNVAIPVAVAPQDLGVAGASGQTTRSHSAAAASPARTDDPAFQKLAFVGMDDDVSVHTHPRGTFRVGGNFKYNLFIDDLAAGTGGRHGMAPTRGGSQGGLRANTLG